MLLSFCCCCLWFSKFSQLLFCYCPSVVPCLYSVHYVDVKKILFYERDDLADVDITLVTNEAKLTDDVV